MPPRFTTSESLRGWVRVAARRLGAGVIVALSWPSVVASAAVGVPVEWGVTVETEPPPSPVIREPAPAASLEAPTDRLARLLRAGRVEEAQASADALLSVEQEPDCRLRVLAAVAADAAGDGASVAALLGSCYQGEPVRPVLDRLTADALCDQGDLHGALRRLRSARRALRDDDVQLEARLDATEVRCRVALDRPSRALSAVEDFQRTYPDAPDGVAFESARATLLDRLGQRRAACALAREIALRHPLDPAAAGARDLARRRLDDGDCAPRRTSARLATARHLVERKKWEVADREVAWLKGALQRGEIEDPERASEVEALVLRYLLGRQRWDEAREVVIARPGPRTPATWSRLADIAAREGQLDDALAALARVPMHPAVRRRRVLDLLVDFGRAEQAQPVLRQVLEDIRHHPLELLFKAMVVEWQAGDLAAAETHAAELVRRSRTRRNRYFHARVLADAGDTAAAIARYQELASVDREDYYGLQARARLSELGLAAARDEGGVLTPLEPSFLHRLRPVLAAGPGGHALVDAEARDRIESERVRRLLDQAAAEVGDVLPRLERARAAFALGLEEVFREDLRASAMDVWRARRARGKPAAYLQRAPGVNLDNRHRPRAVWGRAFSPWARLPSKRSERAAEIARIRALHALWGEPRLVTLARLLDAAEEPMLPRVWALSHNGARFGAPERLRRWSFPTPWRDRLDPLAAEAGIPGVLVHVIMNIESAFHPASISRANARGLFQVMPQTATRIALDLGRAPPAPSELLDRDVSMDFGTRYLGMLLSEFRGQIPLMLAAYNAGPHRVREWLRQRGHLPLDVFVEFIPYAQARGYVKKGITRLAGTLRVHSGAEGLYVARSLDPRALGMVDY